MSLTFETVRKGFGTFFSSAVSTDEADKHFLWVLLQYLKYRSKSDPRISQQIKWEKTGYASSLGEFVLFISNFLHPETFNNVDLEAEQKYDFFRSCDSSWTNSQCFKLCTWNLEGEGSVN